MFHGHIREDFVILHAADDSIIFTRLLYIFKCTVNTGLPTNKQYSVAMVQKYDEVGNGRDRAEVVV